jgi:predicted SAM-dependent methyltransferase
LDAQYIAGQEKLFWSRHPQNEEFEEHMQQVVFSGDFVLDIGCGDLKVHERLLGVDAYAEGPQINVKAYMWDMPFENNSIDGILCMMALEHISKYQVMPTLAEFNRVLKSGAKFIILVPDLFWILDAFKTNPSPEWEMDMLFGVQNHDGEYHKTGFTKEIMEQYFQEAIPNCKILHVYTVNAYNQMSLGFVAEKG